MRSISVYKLSMSSIIDWKLLFLFIVNKEAVGFLNHDEMTPWSVSKRAESILHLLTSENAVECDLSNVITQKSVCTWCQRDGPACVFEAFIKELFEWCHQKTTCRIMCLSPWQCPSPPQISFGTIVSCIRPYSRIWCTIFPWNEPGWVHVWDLEKNGKWDDWNTETHWGQHKSSSHRIVLQIPVIKHS